MLNLWRAILLSVVLIGAQTSALVHTLKHALHPTDTPCAFCLIANHLGQALTSTHSSLPLSALPECIPFLMEGFHREGVTYYLTRAPPSL